MKLIARLLKRFKGPAPAQDAELDAGPNSLILADGECPTCIQLRGELHRAKAEKDAAVLEMNLMAGVLERLKQHELELTALSVARQEVFRTQPRQ